MSRSCLCHHEGLCLPSVKIDAGRELPVSTAGRQALKTTRKKPTARAWSQAHGDSSAAASGLALRACYKLPMTIQETLAPNPVVKAGSVTFSNAAPIAVLAGPCQMESRAHALEMAAALKEMCARVGVGLVYKSSFDKANRTSLSGKRGIGLEAALPVFAEIRESLGLPVVTDVHEIDQCARVAPVVDILQIPAFLCRQTDLLVAAAKTGRVVKIKKGQFLAPWDMKNAVAKVVGSGNQNILLTERGSSFGYNTLVVDMRSLPQMAATGAPVIFDATHSVQQPGGQGTSSGGDRRFVPVLARAAVAVGVAGLFIETHENPDAAPSDGPNMVPLRDFEALLSSWRLITLSRRRRWREGGWCGWYERDCAAVVIVHLSGSFFAGASYKQASSSRQALCIPAQHERTPPPS
jgi:2-dehydro-3-deoxyphosphooctonate aldolase (KDO 8-P synthase)